MSRNDWTVFLAMFGSVFVILTVYDLAYHPDWVAVDAGVFTIITLILLAMAASR